jgi:hypothetical protein
MAKTRRTASVNDTVLCVDEADRAGTFLELEHLTSDQRDSRAIQAERAALAESLGIAAVSVSQTYDSLVSHATGVTAAAHQWRTPLASGQIPGGQDAGRVAFGPRAGGSYDCRGTKMENGPDRLDVPNADGDLFTVLAEARTEPNDGSILIQVTAHEGDPADQGVIIRVKQEGVNAWIVERAIFSLSEQP